MKPRSAQTCLPLLAALLVAVTTLVLVAGAEQTGAGAAALEQQEAGDASRASYVPGPPPPPPEWFPEEPCSRAGGICMHANECGGTLSEKPGLCPKQRAKGAECCHGLSVLETRCSRRGGQCRPTEECNPRVRDARATDCAYGESCCTLVAL